jgi:hypothetical protein
MRTLGLVLLAFFVMLVAAIPLCAKEWRGITPLRSTRADVERILGRSPDASGSWAIYQTREEAISILFASGPPCGTNAQNEWRVPRDTVISITISAKRVVLLSTMNIVESKYEKLRDPHKLNRIEYRNKEEGESISVVDGEVSSFTYFASAKDFDLHCPSSQVESDSARKQYFRLDEYGDLLSRDEKIRLDNFAITLQQRPGSRGYIIGYPGLRTSVSNSLVRLKRARAYLVKERGIDPMRLVQIRGGFRKKFTVELFIVPAGAEAPTPLPQAVPRENNQSRQGPK